MIKTIIYTYLSKAFKIGLWFSILWLVVNFVLFVSDAQNFKPMILLYIVVCFLVYKYLLLMAVSEYKETAEKIESIARKERIKSGKSSGFRNRLDLAMEAAEDQRAKK